MEGEQLEFSELLVKIKGFGEPFAKASVGRECRGKFPAHFVT
jgi:hypothetical protein